MNSAKRLSFWIKAAQAVFLAVAVCFSLGASDAGSRTEDLGRRLMCTCGCAQLLGGCDHVGCPNRGDELTELTASIGQGMTDQQIFDRFVAKYGATVLAAPRTQGFDLVAWIAPFAVFLAALMGTILLIRHWTGSRSQLATQPGGADTASPEIAAIREKIRRETGDGD